MDKRDGPMPEDETQMAIILEKLNSIARRQEEQYADIRNLLNDHEQRIRKVEERVTEINARQTMMAMIQGAFTTVASALAALFGKS